MRPVYTVILSSQNRVGGTHGDALVEIKENLLQNHKKYLCKVKWIHISRQSTTETIRVMYVTIDGLYLVDTYHNTNANRTPFVLIDSSDWGAAKDIIFEPSGHLRTVRLNQNLLRIRFFDAETNMETSSFVDGWIMELQFIEVDE